VAPSSMDVSITIAERGPEMLGRIEYRESTLDRTVATGLLTEFFALLDEQLAAPERTLGSTPPVVVDAMAGRRSGTPVWQAWVRHPQ